MDSLGAMELRTAVAARFAVQLPATATFDHPTPAALAALVHSKLIPPPPQQRRRRTKARPEHGMPRNVVRRRDGAERAGGDVTHVVAAATRFPGAESGARADCQNMVSDT